MNEIQYYKNIRMGADQGLHEKVFNEFKALESNKNVSILILASGHGAFEQRLIDHGYINIESFDIEDNYKANSKHQLILKDLNKDFDDLQGGYDYIFAMELIEHLENQFHFVRNLKKNMQDNTVLFLTTPNIHRKSLRLGFLLTNKIDFFTKEDLYESGHINIILDHVFKKNLSQSNLTVFKEFYNRSYFSKNDFLICTFKLKILYMLYALLNPFLPGGNEVIKIYLIRNKLYR